MASLDFASAKTENRCVQHDTVFKFTKNYANWLRHFEGFSEERATVKRATENRQRKKRQQEEWATENWAKGKMGNKKWEGMKKGQHEVSVGKKGNQKIGQR